MAKDLDMHEHHAVHSDGEDCGSTPAECIVKTRIWQLISIFEMMIGASQGKPKMPHGTSLLLTYQVGGTLVLNTTLSTSRHIQYTQT